MESFGARIVNHIHLFCPAYHAVEIIGEYGLLKTRGGHVEATPNGSRDERALLQPPRINAFIDRGYDDVGDVETTRLQRSHNLDSLQRLTFEMNHFAGQQACGHAEYRLWPRHYAVFLQRGLQSPQSVDICDDMVDVELIDAAVCHSLFLLAVAVKRFDFVKQQRKDA